MRLQFFIQKQIHNKDSTSAEILGAQALLDDQQMYKFQKIINRFLTIVIYKLYYPWEFL